MKTLDLGKLYTCDFCGFQSNSKKEMEQHEKQTCEFNTDTESCMTCMNATFKNIVSVYKGRQYNISCDLNYSIGNKTSRKGCSCAGYKMQQGITPEHRLDLVYVMQALKNNDNKPMVLLIKD
jgi:hypothetical protein